MVTKEEIIIGTEKELLEYFHIFILPHEADRGQNKMFEMKDCSIKDQINNIHNIGMVFYMKCYSKKDELPVNIEFVKEYIRILPPTETIKNSVNI